MSERVAFLSKHETPTRTKITGHQVLTRLFSNTLMVLELAEAVWRAVATCWLFLGVKIAPKLKLRSFSLDYLQEESPIKRNLISA